MKYGKYKITNIKLKTRDICILFFLFVVIGKVVRYTILKEVLVDTSIGHHFLEPILNSNKGFYYFNESGALEAGGTTVRILRLLNIFDLSTYLEFEIAISIIFNIIIFALICKVKPKLDIMEAVFVILSIMVLNIFDFTLAKEPVQMLYFIAIYLVLRFARLPNILKYTMSIGILIVCSITFRSYYLLIAFFMVCCQFISRFGLVKNKKISIKRILLIICIIGMIYYIFLNVCMRVAPLNYAELIRVRTRVSAAASDMRNILPTGNLILFVIDYLIMLIRMLIPIELLPLGIKYLPYVIYQIVTTYFLVKTIINIKRNSKSRNLALYVYMGFLFGSAAFEPDFGSWVRHEAILFPVILLVTGIIPEKGNSKLLS